MRIIFYLYMFTIHTIAIGQLCVRYQMLPDGQVTTANDDIIEAFGTNTSRKCSISCRKSQSCTSYELQSNADGTFVCGLRKTFITNPEHLVHAPGKSAFYLCKYKPKSEAFAESLNLRIQGAPIFHFDIFFSKGRRVDDWCPLREILSPHLHHSNTLINL